MSYIIRKTDGTVLGTILDGTLDTSATSLSLVGRNYSNYGQVMTDNLVKLIENFAYNISPSNPLAGQLWWDTTNNLLKVYTGSTFKVISSATASSNTNIPSTTVAGDIWWDTTDEQLFVYDGTTPYNTAGWKLVGPVWSKVNGKSGAIWEQIQDTGLTWHNVLSVYLDGVRTAIINRSTPFTPANVIPGFTTVQSGFNLYGSMKVIGTTTNADALGNIDASNYLRSDIDDSTAGKLTITNSNGLEIGANSNVSLSVSGSDSLLTHRIAGGNFNVYANVGGVLTRAIYVKGADGLVEVAGDPTANLGIATKQYIDNKITNSPALGGVPTAPTATVGTNTTQIATTAYVLAAFDNSKIFQGDSFVQITDTGANGFANVVLDGAQVMTATSVGVDLKSGATAATQPQVYNSTGNATIATTQYVRTATQWWGGSAKFVSTASPNPGVNDIGSVDGDFWFKREA